MLLFLEIIVAILVFLFTLGVFRRATAYAILLLILSPKAKHIPYGLVSVVFSLLSFWFLYTEALWIINDVKEFLAL